MKATGDTALRVEIVISLLVGNGGQHARKVFGVTPKLATKFILGAAFIDKEIDRFETKTRQSVSSSEHAVAIVVCFEDKDAVQFTDSIMTWPVRERKSNLAACPVVKAWPAPQCSEALLLGQTGEAGTNMVEDASLETDGN